MHNVFDKYDQYFMWDAQNEKMHFIGNKENLIKEIVTKIDTRGYQDPERWDWGYFNYLNVTGNDTARDWYTEAVIENGLLVQVFRYDLYIRKRFLFLDAENRLIDIRNLKEEIIDKVRAITSGNFSYGIKKRFYLKLIRKPKNSFAHTVYRTKRPKLKKIKVFASISEYREFIKPKERDSYLPYYAKTRRVSENWKHKSKSKYQWSKNTKDRKSIRYYFANDYLSEENFFEEDFLMEQEDI